MLSGLFRKFKNGNRDLLSGFNFRKTLFCDESELDYDFVQARSRVVCFFSLSLQGCRNQVQCRICQILFVTLALALLWYQRRRSRKHRNQLRRDLSMSMITAERCGKGNPRARTESIGLVANRFLRYRTASSASASSIVRFFGGGKKENKLLSDLSSASRYLAISSHGAIGDSERPFSNLEKPLESAYRIQWQGPHVQDLIYQTMTPPPSWSEASRSLLQHKRRWKLERRVLLVLGEQTAMVKIQQRGVAMTRSKREDEFSVAADGLGVHVKLPEEGGVLELYVKDSPPDQWMEHCFSSASEAAQFQTDLLAVQFLGQQIFHMYQSFEVIHRGSCAFLGSETVLHDRTLDPENLSSEPSGIAWDDVMRCLGVHYPTMREHLEVLWRVHMSGVDSSSQPGKRRKTFSGDTTAAKSEISGITGSSSQNPEYAGGKRLLLGIVDFFRLFVPLLSEKTIPYSSSSRVRMEKLIQWRKRVAEASVLVQSYVRARVVVNHGWDLTNRYLQEDVEQVYVQRRLAFDDNWDNVRRDVSATNEYYEATVSRDVICQVHSRSDLSEEWSWRQLLLPSASRKVPSLSKYQGYSLVGSHSIQWDPHDAQYPLQPDKDIVLSIPSLRALIEEHPDLDFFIHACFAEGRTSAVTVEVFVRSLPKGIDANFDRSIDRFALADSDLRKQKLECILQIGVEKDGLSFFPAMMLSLISFMLRLTLHGRRHAPQLVTVHDRTTIPAINLSEVGEAFHFGGALRRLDDSGDAPPPNYFASNTHISSRRRNTLATRFLIAYMECGGLSKNVVDFSYVISGTENNEVPERVLGTVRVVSSTRKSCALPVECINDCDEPLRSLRDSLIDVDEKATKTQNRHLDICLLCKILVVDPVVISMPSLGVFFRVFNSSRQRHLTPSMPPLSHGLRRTASVLSSIDPFEEAVNELIEGLRDVSVPVRRGQSIPNLVSGESKNVDSTEVCRVPILRTLTRSDIRRYLVASDCNLKVAAARLVRSGAWRGMVFPIDIRMCRVELQSGVFFQQGFDREGCPIFYFRTSCLGPWRKNEEATIAAVLHRLETSLDKLETPGSSPLRCTLIVMMGHPREMTPAKDEIESRDSVAPSDRECEDDSERSRRASSMVAGLGTENNPRVHSEENWYHHTSRKLILRLIDILLAHYPERLGKALVVSGHGNTHTRTLLRGKLALSVAVRPATTRGKVQFLTRYKDLQKFAEKDVLLKLVGGNAAVVPSVFDCYS